jgi:hypothetical protein
MSIYTAFCQQASGGGTIWIEQVQAADVEEATTVAKQACAEAWEYDLDDVHVLGIAAGNVDILLWDDLGD